MAKGCSYVRRKAECLDTALSRGILVIYYKSPEVPYCYYELVTPVIRAVKINVLSYPWYTVYWPYTTPPRALLLNSLSFSILLHVCGHCTTWAYTCVCVRLCVCVYIPGSYSCLPGSRIASQRLWLVVPLTGTEPASPPQQITWPEWGKHTHMAVSLQYRTVYMCVPE